MLTYADKQDVMYTRKNKWLMSGEDRISKDMYKKEAGVWQGEVELAR
jgi:hypothetical protein